MPKWTGGGRPVYASPVLEGDRKYAASPWKGTLVLPAEPKFEIWSTTVLSPNVFESDDSDSSGTPVIVGDCMVLRLGQYLYCVSDF
ncbi:hypothetical protein [Planctomycetes bacterium CA13]|uniref:hypothetical protein n=1 Tax=Novipirellula herctigrandis TaxID=2527986 RepID=UPI0011B51182